MVPVPIWSSWEALERFSTFMAVGMVEVEVEIEVEIETETETETEVVRLRLRG